MRAEPVTKRRIGIGLAVVAGLLTAGCAAGQRAQTAAERPTINGNNASAGLIDLRNVQVAAPSSGRAYWDSGINVPLELTIVNNSTADDTLTSITSSAATGWGSYASPADAAAAASSSAAPPPGQRVIIPAGSVVSSGLPGSTNTFVLTHTKVRLSPGTTISMTFTFANAGSVSLEVPVALTPNPPASVLPAPKTTGIE